MGQEARTGWVSWWQNTLCSMGQSGNLHPDQEDWECQNISVYFLCSQENSFDCYLVWNTQEPFFLVGPGCWTRVGMLWTVKAVIAIRLSMLEQLKLYLVMVFKVRTKFWLKLTRKYGSYCRWWFHFQLLDCVGSFNLVPQMLSWEILLLLQLFCQWSSSAKSLVDMVCILFSPEKFHALESISFSGQSCEGKISLSFWYNT